MAARVTLRDTRDGFTKTIVDTCVRDEDGFWNWTDGNLSCDCNRLIRLYGWDLDDPRVECSDGMIELVSIELI